ncbi:MAG: sigma-54-dependent Fis family transcriptional regulator, partial [Myxococcales bacterium]|nr:sigma-54-dependent Fis family transcriptional regulator [Myxococcales bacterium]
VEAMKRGAADFLAKPFDRDEVAFTVDKAMRKGRHAEKQPFRPLPAVDPGVPWLGESPAMKETAQTIARAARVTSTVLIRGESGVGKEVAARAIHATSKRAEGPFVPVHCAALPENLLESELFGHEKGAFTGAATRKPGWVEIAQGGTLFLDEIGDISPAVQVKLLRLMAEKTFQRVGGTQTLTADVRFVSATHRDLERMVAEEQFREDLFFRLNVIPIWIAPLRERRADVAPLAHRFCEELGEELGRPDATLDAEAVALLEAQPWPGNVRELRTFVERLLVFSDDDRIGAADVNRELSRSTRSGRSAPPASPASPASGETLEERRMDAERAAILEALEKTHGNKTKAAELLGIARRTLHNKLAELGLTDV